jgi:hypothetical protein
MSAFNGSTIPYYAMGGGLGMAASSASTISTATLNGTHFLNNSIVITGGAWGQLESDLACGCHHSPPLTHASCLFC